MKRAVITGIGIQCAIGNSVNEVKENLFDYKNNSELTFNTPVTNENFQYFLDKSISRIKNCEFDIFNHYAMASFHMALRDAELTTDDVNLMKDHVSLVYSTATENTDLTCAEKILDKQMLRNLAKRDSLVQLIQKEIDFHGNITISNSSCAAGGIAVASAFDEIRFNNKSIVLTGGIEVNSVTQFCGFRILSALGQQGSRPFNLDRDGVSLGNASVFLVIEELTHALKRDANIYAEVCGYGLANDAYHPTAPHPDGLGAILSMKKALKSAKIRAQDIHYVNAHGTGTPSNDYIELLAIEAVFNSNESLFVSSTKSLTGHSLAAAGVLEAAFTVLALKEQRVIPNYKLTNPVKGHLNTVKLATQSHHERINYALSNSFAFGGNCVSVVFSHYHASEAE